MYAVIEVGGKQQIVNKDDVLLIEKIETEQGKDVSLDKVLLIVSDDNIEIGQPYLKGASVKAEVLGQTKGEKLVSYKYRRRKSSHWKKGHRQKLTRIKIKDIKF